MVGFPLGATTTDVKQYETRRVIYDGANEVDMVINVGALKSGELGVVERDIAAVVSACKDCGVLSKVIIEAALLTDEEKVTACALSKAAGADYVKTSTGFGPGGATVADVELMRRVVGPDIGVKAAGGVRDYEALRNLVSAGASRVGASAGVKIVQESKRGAQPSLSAVGAVPRNPLTDSSHLIANAQASEGWSGVRESNPPSWLGKPEHYHYANPAKGRIY